MCRKDGDGNNRRREQKRHEQLSATKQDAQDGKAESIVEKMLECAVDNMAGEQLPQLRDEWRA